MSKEKLRNSLVFTLLFLACLALIDYPFLARLYNQSRQGEVSVSYDRALAEVPDRGKQEILEKAREYNRRLASGTGMDLQAAFEERERSGEASDDAEELHREYESLLNCGEDGVMGRVEIPKIKVELLIYHGTAEAALQKGAGHLEGSSLPVGGADTNACISAHRGLADKKMFSSLDELEEGDIFFLDVLEEKLCYRVSAIRIVTPEDTEELGIRRGEDLVTLITCTPYGINTHRLCVEGTRIPYTEEAQEEARQQAEEKVPARFAQDWLWLPVTLFLLIVMCAMLIRYNRKPK